MEMTRSVLTVWDPILLHHQADISVHGNDMFSAYSMGSILLHHQADISVHGNDVFSAYSMGSNIVTFGV